MFGCEAGPDLELLAEPPDLLALGTSCSLNFSSEAISRLFCASLGDVAYCGRFTPRPKSGEAVAGPFVLELPSLRFLIEPMTSSDGTRPFSWYAI